ncbi:PTS sugar transporter subunit IIA [Legionella sp. CNM-1927-20]|uniref:PTS sugar transporter subunit IIA n=1 Tax=Legionella sp. CNM-1927-20 TaxID=3422221 RepID=UPI00403AADBD
MNLGYFIAPQHVYIDLASQSKTAVFHKISELFTTTIPELNFNELFDAFWHRELLGSTAIGHGIIIPHIRLPTINQPKACLIKLINPVDFGAEDKQPADLVVGLIVPPNQEEHHLTILAAIIKQFSDSSFRNACRKANNAESLYALVVNGALETQAS